MKKAVSLLLAIALSLSLVGCGNAPAPDPGSTLNALLFALFREDTTEMGNLFGYTSREAILGDWLDNEDPRSVTTGEFIDGFTSSALQEGVTIDESVVNAFRSAVFDALSRVPFTCTTDKIDAENGTAVVSVAISTFPEDCFGDAALTYIYTNHLDALLAAGNDSAAIYRVIFAALTEYAQQLQPTEQTKTLLVTCQLTKVVRNGKTRSCWAPTNTSAFGEQFVYAAFDID